MLGVTIAEPGRVELTGKAVERPGKGFVKLRLLIGGICGSDLSAFLGTSPMVSYPRVIGHEVVGEVIETGEGEEAWLGKVVTVEPYMDCGECYACSIGRYNCCSNLKVMGVHIDGGFQEEFIVPGRKLFAIPDGMDVETAVLAEPLTISTHAVQRTGAAKGEKAIIFGAGAIGLLALQVVTSYIGGEALVVDIREERLQTALKLGAAKVFNASGYKGEGTSPELVQMVKDWTGGVGVPIAIEASGSPASTAGAIDCLSQAGRVALVGWNKKPIQVDTVQLMRKEASLLGSRNSADTFPLALEILSRGHIDVSTMITHKLPLELGLRGLELMNTPSEQAIKVVLTL